MMSNTYTLIVQPSSPGANAKDVDGAQWLNPCLRDSAISNHQSLQSVRFTLSRNDEVLEGQDPLEIRIY
jgi:hypothetical protein